MVENLLCNQNLLVNWVTILERIKVIEEINLILILEIFCTFYFFCTYFVRVKSCANFCTLCWGCLLCYQECNVTNIIEEIKLVFLHYLLSLALHFIPENSFCTSYFENVFMFLRFYLFLTDDNVTKNG